MNRRLLIVISVLFFCFYGFLVISSTQKQIQKAKSICQDAAPDNHPTFYLPKSYQDNGGTPNSYSYKGPDNSGCGGFTMTDWIIAVASVAMAFFAAVTLKLLIDADKTTRQKMRAYVHVEHPMLIRDGSRWHYEFFYHNLGETPAENVTISAKAHPNLAVLYQNQRAPVGPRQKLPWKTETITPEISSQWIKEYGEKAVIFIHGRIDYEDIFREKHVTEFRFKHDWKDPNAVIEAVAEGNKVT